MTYKEYQFFKKMNNLLDDKNLKNIINNIGDKIEKNPRICSICGIVETRHNVIIFGDEKNGFICDSCFFSKN